MKTGEDPYENRRWRARWSGFAARLGHRPRRQQPREGSMPADGRSSRPRIGLRTSGIRLPPLRYCLRRLTKMRAELSPLPQSCDEDDRDATRWIRWAACSRPLQTRTHETKQLSSYTQTDPMGAPPAPLNMQVIPSGANGTRTRDTHTARMRRECVTRHDTPKMGP